MNFIITLGLLWTAKYIAKILAYLGDKEGEQEEKLKKNGAKTMISIIIAASIMLIIQMIETIKVF